MPKDFPRTRRVAEQIKRELSTLIMEEVQDPRLKMPSVSEVQLTRDFSHARVFISSLDFDHGADSSAEALQDYAGMLRQRLGKRLRLRTIPELHFTADHLQEEAMRMDALIDEVVAKERNGKFGSGSSDDNSKD